MWQNLIKVSFYLIENEIFLSFVVYIIYIFASNNNPNSKLQTMKCDTLLATVLHHNEMWNQQRALSDDMKKEILSLTERLKKKTYKVNCFVDLM